MINNNLNTRNTLQEYTEDNIYLSDLAYLIELHNEIQAMKNNLLMHSVTAENMIDNAPITKDVRDKFHTVLNNIKRNYEVF